MVREGESTTYQYEGIDSTFLIVQTKINQVLIYKTSILVSPFCVTFLSKITLKGQSINLYTIDNLIVNFTGQFS